MQIARRTWKLPRNRLPDVCAHLGIALNHHEALSDAEACARIAIAARQAGARDVIAVVQPHRYSRLATLFEEFCACMNDAGTVIIADVYAAGEAPMEGVDKDALVEGLRARGHRSVVPLPGPDSLAEMIHAIARPGDYVVCLGAGSITNWAHALPVQLTELQSRARGRLAGAMK